MEKNVKRINFIKALIILATAAGILLLLSKILISKSEDGINQFDAFYKQPKDSIDVLFCGSSKAYRDVSTGVLWDEFGIASFDLGGAEAPAWVTYYQLREALDYQNPKVICYEMTVAAMYNFSHQKNSWASFNSYGMRWTSNRIEQLRANSKGDDFYLRLNPFNIMHGRYNDLNENDFKNIRNTVNYKGFYPSETHEEVEPTELIPETETEPCPEKDEDYIRMIIGLAQEKSIPLIFFASPYRSPAEEQRIINYVGEIADSEGVTFIDFNRRYKEFGMDFSEDMADTDHLSVSGIHKFTSYFGSLLKEAYDLPDRRGDERYVSWEWDAAMQRNKDTDLKIKACKKADEGLGMTDETYLAFSVRDGQALIYDGGRVDQMQDVSENGEEPFRMTFRCGDDTFLFMEEGKDYNRTVSLFVNDTEYQKELKDVVFIYDKLRHEYVKALYY